MTARRETQAAARERMAYQGPKARPCCWQCRHVAETIIRPDSPFEAIDLRCSLAGFPVRRGGCCNEFAPVKVVQQVAMRQTWRPRQAAPAGFVDTQTLPLL